MNPNFRKYPEPTSEIKEKIIEKFRFDKLNSSPKIAAEFNIPIVQVNRIIDQYLSSRCNQHHNN